MPDGSTISKPSESPQEPYHKGTLKLRKSLYDELRMAMIRRGVRDLQDAIGQAVRLWISGVFMVPIPADLAPRVNELANSRGISPNDLVLEVLRTQVALSSQAKEGQQVGPGSTAVPIHKDSLSGQNDLVIESIHGAGTTPTPNERELPWLKRALSVLRSRKPGLSGALKSNLLQFDHLATTWAEGHGDKDRGAARPSRRGKQEGADKDQPTVLPIGGAGTGPDSLFARVDEALDAIEEAQKEGLPGKGRTPGKTG